MTAPLRSSSSRVRPVAVIDIGTTSIRMAIAELQPEGGVRRLESLSQAVELGKDTFTRGEISREVMEECVTVLRMYRLKLREYGIERPEDIRLVATSAVREAINRITFIDRLYVATGLSVEVLDEAEVHRITYLGVQRLLKAHPEWARAYNVVVEVGGGNTELVALDAGNIGFTHAFRLGSLRLRQILTSHRIPRSKARQVLTGEIHGQLEPYTDLLRSRQEVNLLVMGGDVRFAAEMILQTGVTDDRLLKLPVAELRKFVESVFSETEEGLVSEYHLPFPEAEVLGPALLANLLMAEVLGVDHLLVCAINLRDGLLRDMADGRTWTEDFRKQIHRAAWELARRYDVDEDHAKNVAELGRQLFRQLKPLHELDDRYETLLMVAAALHETGGYINTSSLHKHSMYLITNSTLFGLTSDDLAVVGLVARYHRRSMPKTTHQPYASMERGRRVVISKLAAILRIAIALDASRSQRIRTIACTTNSRRVIISVPAVAELSVEQIALRRNRQFFESIFGLDVMLRSQVAPSISGPSAQLPSD